MTRGSKVLTRAEVGDLLEKLCVDMGFCLPPAEHNKLLENPPQDPGVFTDAVFLAEGLNPQTARRDLYREVRDFVTTAFRHSAELAEVENASALLSTMRRPE
jgi:hypothetical protein